MTSNKQLMSMSTHTTSSDYSSQHNENTHEQQTTTNSKMNNNNNNNNNYNKQPNRPQILISDTSKQKSPGHLVISRRGRLKQILILVLFFIGLIVCVSSIVCILLLPAFVSNQIARKLVLKNNSLLLERWSKPNVPMYFKVWIFDLKNAHQIAQDKTIKPQLEEIGPFVFNLRRQKDVVSFAGDNLYYTERKVYHFNRELSCCAINTTVTIPNIPLVAVVDRALSYNLPLVGRFIPRLINRAIQSLREQLFVRKQVREILFDGYEVDLLKMVSRIGSLVGLPQQSQRFALLKGRNDTWRPEQDGVWAINTGARDRQRFGKVSSWNSYKQLPFWPEKQCNVINGSDGTLFPPPIKNNEPLYIFNQELCRTVNLIYDGPSDVRSIKAYRFVLNPMNFAHTMSSKSTSGGGGGPLSTTAAAAAASSPTLPVDDVASISSSMPVNHRRPHTDTPTQSAAIPPQARRTADALRASSSEVNSRQVGPSAGPPLASMTNNLNSGDNSPKSISQQAGLVQAAQLRHERPAQPLKRNPFTCFCDRKSTNLNGVNVCEFDGLIDLSKCSKQAQVIFGSMPHFHQSDSRLANQVDGLQANATKHTTYLDIEPNTGLVLGGKRRVQLNLLIKNNNEVDGFENINDMLVPLVWFEESAQIPEESARKFKSLYTDRIKLVNLVLLSLLVASIALLAIDLRLLLASSYWQSFKLTLVSSATKVVGSTGGKAEEKKKKKNKKNPRIISSSLNSSNESEFKQQKHSSSDTTSGITEMASQLGASDNFLNNNHHSSTKRSHSPLLINELANEQSGSESTPEGSPELRKWSPGRLIRNNYAEGATSNKANKQLNFYNSPATATTTVMVDAAKGGPGAHKTIRGKPTTKQSPTIVNLNGAQTPTSATVDQSHNGS